jgi:hypothetical protein
VTIIAQMRITQQILPAAVGSGHDAQSAFELHELGHEPPSDPLPLPILGIAPELSKAS